MVDFIKKQNKKKFIHSRIFLFFLGILCIVSFFSVLDIWKKTKDPRNERNLAEARFDELKKREEDLSKKIARIKTDEGIEESIRDKFRVSKEGEELIVVLEPVLDKNNDQNQKKSFLDFLKNMFK